MKEIPIKIGDICRLVPEGYWDYRAKEDAKKYNVEVVGNGTFKNTYLVRCIGKLLPRFTHKMGVAFDWDVRKENIEVIKRADGQLKFDFMLE